jgi:signal transduction histidine kinase
MNTTGHEQARILIIDDDPACLALYEHSLNRLGFGNLLLLQDSTEILQRLGDFQPDLVITDLDMPVIGGICIVSLIQELTPAEEFLPVLVVTGHVSPTAKREALAAGATDFLAKPCDMFELHARVRNLLRIRTQQQAAQTQSRELERTVAKRTFALGKALIDLKDTQRMALQEERLRAFAQMAGGVVHDFNNALMTITGYSGLLLSEPEVLKDEAETRSILTTIHTVAGDAAEVVDRLRELYNTHDAKQEFGSVNLNDVIKDAVQFTQPKWHGLALAEGRRIRFEYDLAEEPIVQGRLAELRELVMNLIFNAVDAMPQGGVITCSTRSRDLHAILEIVDQGVGMPPEVRERCLEPFFTTKGDAGTGLGLAMVTSIVQRHGGKMEIESEPGAGALIRIELPIGVEKRKAPEEAKTPEARGLRILMVDDDPHMRIVIARMLTRNGHEVVQAISAIDALERAGQAQFDLLLTDHAMPGMNGMELASKMRETNPGQKVVLLTGYPLHPEAVPSKMSVLKKPAEPRELLTAIARAMAA